MGAGGKGEVGLRCPRRRERADVLGVGSSEGVAWGGERGLQFLLALASRIGKELGKERALVFLLLE